MPSATNALVEARAIGQSIWLDYIQRSLMHSGELQALIDSDQINGITSNPAIFESAIAKSDEYDQQIANIIQRTPDVSSTELFRQLAVTDIGDAADMLLPQYQSSRGDDGMVSIEVAPDLADDAQATVQEARSLHSALARPNVMIKVPATLAGVKAFEQLTAEGISVNVTLLFSLQRYQAIAEAYLTGLEKRHSAGEPINHIASVASFFVSRVDARIDPLLEKHDNQAVASSLLGQIAIANAKAAYVHYNSLVSNQRFAQLHAHGALPQRLLWASTGTKSPAYSDVYYVEELLGPDTVNTLPPKTMDAFRDHGSATDKLSATSAGETDATLRQLAELNIDLNSITAELEVEGVASFAEAYARLLEAIVDKGKTLQKSA